MAIDVPNDVPRSVSTPAQPADAGEKAAEAPRASAPATFVAPPAPPEEPPDETVLPVGGREQALLRPEVDGLLARLTDPPTQADYAALAEGLAAGKVSGSALRRLEQFLELGLETGRFRRQLGAIDAQALHRLYGRTPRGAAVAAALSGVNDALAALAGQTLDRLAVTAKGPGDYELTIDTDQGHLVVALGPAGARLVSVELAL